MVFLENLWSVTQSLGIWFIFGLFIAGLMHLYIPEQLFKKWLGKSSFTNVIKAAFIGVPMPLCSCGVVPTVITLRKKGASRSSCLSFLISTPQTGVDSLLVSASFLSWPFAVFKLVSAFIIGILGGGIHQLVETANDKEQEIDISELSEPPQKKSLSELYNFAVNELFYNIWRWMITGIIAAALISTLVSDDFLSNSYFSDPLYGSLAALIVSIPLYICATSSVPIAAALVAKGMSPAIAIVFLIAGPATNIATIGLIYKSFGKLFTTIYLLSVSVGSVVCALLFSSVISVNIPDLIHHHSSSPLETLGGFVFASFLVFFLIKDIKIYLQSKQVAGTESLVFNVSGVTCQGCVNKVRTAIITKQLAISVSGDPEANTITVVGKELDQHKLEQTIINIGYKIIGA